MFRSTRSLRRKPLSVFVQVALPTMLAMSIGHAATCTVNSATDDPADATAKVTAVPPGAWSGANASVVTLRDCIVAANLMTGASGAPSGTMTIDTGSIAGSTIALGDSLPMVFNNTTIGGTGSAVTIDGAGTHRIFFVSGLPDSTVTPLPNPDGAQAISVNLTNLVLQNGKALGGSGNAGGMGAGGALFVNQNASVSLSNVGFSGNSAAGGTGDSGGTRAGGGGMGGSTTTYAAGGISGNGSDYAGGGIGTDAATTNGGGFGATGVGQISSVQNFGSGFGGGTGFGSAGGIGGGGGNYAAGGFGGGGGKNANGGFGGGGGQSGGEGGGGYNGGFGGGGGSGRDGFYGLFKQGYAGVPGGNGGFGAGGAGGGGGGGCTAEVGGYAGGLGGAAGSGGIGGGFGAAGANGDPCVSGGGRSADGAPGGGGGGAGFGGAVFVRTGGTLTVQSSSPAVGGTTVSGGSVTGGTGVNNGAGAGSGLFLMSGATTTFDIATAETISDNIQDDSANSLPGGTYSAGSGGGAAISKMGAGTLVFGSGTLDTYAGVTTINAGTLQLDGFLTASPITINSGGTLSGTGGTSAGVSLNSGGAISPGDSPGTLSAGSLMWNGDGAGNAQMNWQLGVDNTPANTDLLMLNFALGKGSAGTFKFHFTDGGGGPPTPGTTYTLIRYTSTTFALDASDFTFDYSGALPGGLQGTFALTGSAPPPVAPIHNAPTSALPPNALTFTAAALPPTIAKAFSPTSIPLNGTTKLTFNLGNPNANIALSNVTFSDNLPAGLAVASTPNASNTCGGTFAPAAADTTLNFTGGALAISASCAISVDVQGTTAGLKNNTTSTITSTESLTAAGTAASASVTVVSPPTIQKAFNPTAIGPAGTSTLSFTIANANATPLTGVNFTDNLPAGLVVAVAPNAVDNCAGTFTAAAGASSVSLTGGAVGANTSCTLSVDVHGTTTGVKNNTTGPVSSTEGGQGAVSNTAVLTINVTPVRLQSFEVD